MTYAYDFISEEKNNPLEQEPYLSINRKLKDCGDDISGKQIKYAISRHKSGFMMVLIWIDIIAMTLC